MATTSNAERKLARQMAETERMARFSRLFSFSLERVFDNDRPIVNPDGEIVAGPRDSLMNTGLTSAQAR